MTDDEREVQIRAWEELHRGEQIGYIPVLAFVLRRLDEARAERDMADRSHQQTEESLTARLDARQTELLEANNREVERRRVVEIERDAAIEDLRTQLRAGDVLLAANNLEHKKRLVGEVENEWLRRLLRWCRPRLKHKSDPVWLDKYLALGPSPAPEDEPPVTQSQADVPKHEVQHHAGNPKLCRVTGLRLKAMPECEGGGWATDEHTAKIIADALNAPEGQHAHSLINEISNASQGGQTMRIATALEQMKAAGG